MPSISSTTAPQPTSTTGTAACATLLHMPMRRTAPAGAGGGSRARCCESPLADPSTPCTPVCRACALKPSGPPAVHAWRQGLCVRVPSVYRVPCQALLRGLCLLLLSPFSGRSCYKCQHVIVFGYMLIISSVVVFLCTSSDLSPVEYRGGRGLVVRAQTVNKVDKDEVKGG